MNTVDVIETRRAGLDAEIQGVERQLQQSLANTFADAGAPPELSEEQRKELRFHEQEARFANQKLNAYESVRSKPHPSTDGNSTGGAA